MIAVITGNFGKKVSLLITTVSIIFFIAFVGVQAPIVRAGIMGILTFVGIALGRKTTVMYTLVLSLIFIALIWPEWLTTISLQLSYGATIGIVLFGRKKDGNESGLKQELRTSLAAQVFTAPLIFVYFHQISLISPIANVAVAFMVAPIMVMGFITVILGKLSFILGFIPAAITYALLSYVVTVVEVLSKIPFALLSL
jgi:competence protein ComEC